MEKICVAVRVRPPVTPDSSNCGAYWRVEDNRISLHKPLGTPFSGLSFTFDHVFDQSCTNSTVYELLTKDIIHAAVDGFNGTAFAYGQTSSGKTFTMNGSENDPGIIHLAIKDIFEKIYMTTDREFLIRVSYMEIYNEEINDLFAVENQKLPIHESLERGVFVAGLREEIVNSAEQVLNLIKSGEVNRHFGETNMNARSSRSHTIFRMVIESKAKEANPSNKYSSSDAIRVSVLNLVDLAGSERIAKTGAGGVRLKEGKYINKSLMILGNVINKLSDGVKQRGHIPYRDSKLTRILQPALGGNAKTSVICTIAPEEVHVEETKGTLQFASRAKRITNCAQVNEILTDAALLKRQKQEIEELRMKLQGSHSGVLEQEILKLRNDMLKYELERETLEMELEEERKLHKDRDKCIKEQQMKIVNLSSLVTLPDCDRNNSQVSVSDAIRGCNEESNENQSIFQEEEAFSTPCFKALPSAFVAKRSNYSRLPEYSPLPDTFISNIADEDEWLKLNGGYVADLDALEITPFRKVQSFPPSDSTPGGSNKGYEQEVQNLKRQLELAVDEKNELERSNRQQLQLNNQLMEEISELRQESQLIREVPETLCETLVNCKDMYEDVMSLMQSFVADEKSPTSLLLSSTNEMGTSLFSTLGTFFSMVLDGKRNFAEHNTLIEEQFKVLYDKLNSTRTLLEESTLEAKRMHADKDKLETELHTITGKYECLEKELQLENQLLEESKERYQNLDRKFRILNEQTDSMLETISNSSQKLELIKEEKEKLSQNLNTEVQRRKELEEGIKQFSVAFSLRQQSFVSFHGEFKTRIDKFRAHNPLVPKSHIKG